MRRLQRHKQDGVWRKSKLKTTMGERLGMQEMLYWDDYSEGTFVGGNGTAFNLHADQMLTSNIGSQFQGHKLLAIWGYPDETNSVLNTHFRAVLSPPLSDDHLQLLRRACCVAVVPPGAVWFFSGANAHSACNLGYGMGREGVATPPTLCLNSYEAFCNTNLTHARVMISTNTPVHWKGSWMDEKELEDFREDVRDNLKGLTRSLGDGSMRPEAIPSVMQVLETVSPWATGERYDPRNQNHELAPFKKRKAEVMERFCSRRTKDESG